MKEANITKRLEVFQERAETGAAALADLREMQGKLKTPGDALLWAGLVVDYIGENQRDWGGAAEVLATVADRLGLRGHPIFAARLAVAFYMSGATDSFLAAESDAAVGAATEAIPAIVWIRLGCAEAILAGVDSVPPIWLCSVLRLAESMDETTRFDGSLAAATNNIASALLKADLKNKLNAEALELSANASHKFWARAGGWVEQERSEYLRALAYNALGKFLDAERAAQRGLAIIKREWGRACRRSLSSCRASFC